MRTAGIIAVMLLVSAHFGATVVPAQIYDWYEANAFGYADKNNQALPKKLTLGTILPQKIAQNEAYVCIWHQTSLPNPSKGRFTAKCTISRGGEPVDSLKFSRKPSQNVVCQCKKTEELKKQDSLVCKVKLSGYQKLRMSSDARDWSNLAVGFSRSPEIWCG